MLDRARYDLDWLLGAIRSGYDPNYLFFWGHRSKAGGDISKSCLSQWWPAKFTADENTYLSAEHWMMAEKARLFDDAEIYKKVLEVSDPSEAKALGRQIRAFDQLIWDQHKFEIVVTGNTHKFRQNPQLKSFLLATEHRVLVEASPVDKIWGIGLSQDDSRVRVASEWRGENLLGFALMTARDNLR